MVRSDSYRGFKKKNFTHKLVLTRQTHRQVIDLINLTTGHETNLEGCERGLISQQVDEEQVFK